MTAPSRLFFDEGGFDSRNARALLNSSSKETWNASGQPYYEIDVDFFLLELDSYAA